MENHQNAAGGVFVLLTINIGYSNCQGEDKMTHVEWSTFSVDQEPSSSRTLCYRFDVNFDPFQGPGT